jgi:Ca2+-binding RTX toxin-like protein
MNVSLAIEGDAYLLDGRAPGNFRLSVLPDLVVIDGELLLETVVGVALYEIWWDGTASAPTKYYLRAVDGVEIKTDTIALGLAAQAGWRVTSDPYFVDINLQSAGARAVNQNQYASGMFVIDVGGGAVDYSIDPSITLQSQAGRYLLTQDNPTGQRNSTWGPLWIDRIPRIDMSDPVTAWAMSVDVTAVSVVVPEALRPVTPEWASPGQVTTFSFETDDVQVFTDDSGNFLADTRARFTDLVAVIVEPALIDKVIDLYAGGPFGAAALTNLNAARETVSFTGGFRERVSTIIERLLSTDDLPGAEAAWGNFNDWLDGELTARIGSDAASRYSGMSIGLGETQSSAFSFGIGSLSGYVNRDVLIGSDGSDKLFGNGGDDSISGGGGNDTIDGGTGNDTINGGAGIDSAVYQLPRVDHTLTATGQGAYTVATRSGAASTDTLVGIERLQFSDVSVALDLGGNAGAVAKILGAVFGKAEVANVVYAGIGLHYIDGGMSYESLVQLAIDARLGAGASHGAVVELLYTNVVGVPPGAADRGYFVGLLDSGAYTVAGLGVLAADIDLNVANVNLLGLAQQGLEYATYLGG